MGKPSEISQQQRKSPHPTEGCDRSCLMVSWARCDLCLFAHRPTMHPRKPLWHRFACDGDTVLRALRCKSPPPFRFGLLRWERDVASQFWTQKANSTPKVIIVKKKRNASQHNISSRRLHWDQADESHPSVNIYTGSGQEDRAYIPGFSIGMDSTQSSPRTNPLVRRQ
mmetsp:Transcript_9036/g.20876  ORF Transcript_9036/g.20876 Transcript_9036/m.20876 type:complete len:168 (-) Transcript_9036:209-712(-)